MSTKRKRDPFGRLRAPSPSRSEGCRVPRNPKTDLHLLTAFGSFFQKESGPYFSSIYPMSPPARHAPSPNRPSAGSTRPAPALTEQDRRAILGVCDHLIGQAGRTTLAMALRGSRAKRVLQFEAAQARGYGHYAGVPEGEVLARIDALITEGVLRLERRDGFPLLGYTERGRELAMHYVAEEWLEILRARVQPVAEGSALELPFLMAVMPERNQTTVLLLADLAGREADSTWLPLLRAWQSVETRRVRARLAIMIAAMDQAGG